MLNYLLSDPGPQGMRGNPRLTFGLKFRVGCTCSCWARGVPQGW